MKCSLGRGSQRTEDTFNKPNQKRRDQKSMTRQNANERILDQPETTCDIGTLHPYSKLNIKAAKFWARLLTCAKLVTGGVEMRSIWSHVRKDWRRL